MRRQLVCGLLAAVAAVAISAAGAGGARASLGVPRSLGTVGVSGPAVRLPPGPGSQLWVARYTGSGNNGVAYSVAISPGGGRVFVTGQSAGTNGGVDYATVAYNPATGARLWAARYNGPTNSWNAAQAVAVSPGGGAVFVTGVSQGTTSGLDYATVAYNAATGARLWVKRYNGPGNGDDGATSAVVSPDGGRVFVTGYSQGTTSGLDYATVAYNAATGARLWVKRYNGPGNGDDFGQSLAVSPDGRAVYITGVSKGTTSGDDYATVAYNAVTGARRWAARYNGPGNGLDSAHSVAVSPGGRSVYVTGSSSGSGYATVAYNAATGARRWAARYNGPVPAYDPALSVAISPRGGTVFVTGQSQGTTSGLDYATVAYNAVTGARRWAARYNGPGNGDDAATSAAVSPDGETVYVTGYSQRTASGVASDYATVAYNAATGARRWAARYTGPATGADVAYSVAVSPATGTVYVTGTNWGGRTAGDDFATVAYQP